MFGNDFDLIQVEDVFVFGRSVFCFGAFSEDLMRAIVGNGFKEFLKRPEGFVAGVVAYEQVKFGVMAFEIIDLAVKEAALNESFSGVVSGLDRVSEPQDGEVSFEVFEPVGDVLTAYAKAVGAACDLGGLFQRVEAIVKSDAVQDHFERELAPLVDKGSEFSLAPLTEVELNGFIFLFSFSLPGDVGAVAVGTIYDRFGLGRPAHKTVRI